MRASMATSMRASMAGWACLHAWRVETYGGDCLDCCHVQNSSFGRDQLTFLSCCLPLFGKTIAPRARHLPLAHLHSVDSRAEDRVPADDLDKNFAQPLV